MMKYVLMLILLCVFIVPLYATSPEDGFYLQAIYPTTATYQVKTPRGNRNLGLGQRYDLSVEKANILPQNNSNTEFTLFLQLKDGTTSLPSDCALVVDGIGHPLGGVSYFGNGQHCIIQSTITGEENARKIAKYLGITASYEKYREYSVEVTFTPEKSEFKVGKDVFVTLRIKNTCPHSIVFRISGKNKADNGSYYFTATYHDKPVADIDPKRFLGGARAIKLSDTVELKPGETFSDTVNLKKWFAFNGTGAYSVYGRYNMYMQEAGIDKYFCWGYLVSTDFVINIK